MSGGGVVHTATRHNSLAPPVCKTLDPQLLILVCPSSVRISAHSLQKALKMTEQGSPISNLGACRLLVVLKREEKE